MRIASTLILALTLTACGAAEKKVDRPAPYTGALTFERIDQARGAAQLRDDWEDALAKVAAVAGAPTAKTDTSATWALSDGEHCASFQLTRKENRVGGTSGQPKIAKADFTDAPNNFTECDALAKAK